MVPVTFVWWLTQRGSMPAPWTLHAGPGWAAYGPLLAILVLGVVGTGLAYMLQFDVVRGAGVTVSATVTYLIPVVSVALGVLVLGEHLAWPQLVGAVIVVGSALVVGLPARHRRQPVVATEPAACEVTAG
jgi:drug/metabolite transporter (DMT)-like permease